MKRENFETINNSDNNTEINQTDQFIEIAGEVESTRKFREAKNLDDLKGILTEMGVVKSDNGEEKWKASSIIADIETFVEERTLNKSFVQQTFDQYGNRELTNIILSLSNLEESIPVILTAEEHELIFSSNPNDLKIQQLMEEKGLKPNGGFVEVIINGKKEFMNTDLNDLGTITELKKAT